MYGENQMMIYCPVCSKDTLCFESDRMKVSDDISYFWTNTYECYNEKCRAVFYVTMLKLGNVNPQNPQSHPDPSREALSTENI